VKAGDGENVDKALASESVTDVADVLGSGVKFAEE